MNTPKRTFRIKDIDYTTLKAIAFLDNSTPSDIVNQALAEYVAKWGRGWQGTKRGNPNFVKKSETPTK